MSTVKNWIEAIRPRTLPLSVSGILVGSGAAFSIGKGSWTVLLLALATTICYQILSNLANDLGDGLKGTDNANRIGPARCIQQGTISIAQMKRAISLFVFISILFSGLLIYFGTRHMSGNTGVFYIVLASACIIAAITYTVGKKAYGYVGLGDPMVFLFFGIVTVCGVYPMHTGELDVQLFFPAAGIGMLSTAVLNLNNMRDYSNDKQMGKRTLVVMMGQDFAKMYHSILLLVGIVCLLIWTVALKNDWIVVSYIPLAVLLFHLRKVMGVKNAKEYDPELKVVALSVFFTSLLLFLILLWHG
jgi:1,4-dihydroxy-2-naphthoate octaprenyltransferase